MIRILEEFKAVGLRAAEQHLRFTILSLSRAITYRALGSAGPWAGLAQAALPLRGRYVDHQLFLMRFPLHDCHYTPRLSS